MGSRPGRGDKNKEPEGRRVAEPGCARPASQWLDAARNRHAGLHARQRGQRLPRRRPSLPSLSPRPAHPPLWCTPMPRRSMGRMPPIWGSFRSSSAGQGVEQGWGRVLGTLAATGQRLAGSVQRRAAAPGEAAQWCSAGALPLQQRQRQQQQPANSGGSTQRMLAAHPAGSQMRRSRCRPPAADSSSGSSPNPTTAPPPPKRTRQAVDGRAKDAVHQLLLIVLIQVQAQHLRKLHGVAGRRAATEQAHAAGLLRQRGIELN